MIAAGSKVFVASGNAGKVSEFRDLLSPYGLEILSPVDVGDYESPIEDGKDFSANALIKARYASLRYGMLAIADDSGLCCLALGGEPGVMTARFGGDISYDDKVRLLWQRLGDNDKSAYFACAIACVGVGMEEVFYAELQGELIYPAENLGGWGYDPYFIPSGYDCSFAGLGEVKKNQISHRALALKKMKTHFFGNDL